MALPQTNARIQSIDGLRGFAVLLVFYTHLSEMLVGLAGPHTWVLAWGHFVDLGRVGVVLFFAISGFVIPATLKRSSGRGVRAFAINRFWRLFPSFWLSVLPAAVTAVLFQGRHLHGQDVALNFTMVPLWFGALPASGAYWTLAVELVFYVTCVAFFIGRAERSSFVYALCSLALFAMFLSSQPSVVSDLLNNVRIAPESFFFALHLSIMLWASIVRMWWNGDEVDPLSRFYCLGFGAYWLLNMPIRLAIAYASNDFSQISPLLVYGYSLGIAAFAVGLLLVRPTYKPLVWIGRISYSVYLWHGAIPLLLIWGASHFVGLPGLYWLTMVACVGITLAVSHVLYTWVELPCVRIGHRMAAGRATAVAAGHEPGFTARTSPAHPSLGRSSSL